MLAPAAEVPLDSLVEIKRYPNRKLYSAGGYVTLRKVGVLLREGRRVRVTETRSGKDVTAYTLAQLIAQEAERGLPVYDADALGAAICGATTPVSTRSRKRAA